MIASILVYRGIAIIGIDLDENILYLLKGMLQINPAKRLHPEQII